MRLGLRVNAAARLVAFLVITLLVAGVHAGAGSASPRRRVASGSDDHCPLTGLKAPRRVDVSRPAIAVKVDNGSESHDPSGLQRADLVYEMVVEGGVTRFMGIWHCRNAHEVGPVRSARLDDAALLAPFTDVLVFSGANKAVADELDSSGITALDEAGTDGALYRTTDDPNDIDDLYADLAAVRKLVADAKGPRTEVFAFGDAADGGRKAAAVTLKFGATTVEYRFKHGLWRRFQGGELHTTASGRAIEPVNVLVQRVSVTKSSIVDSAGNPSPHYQLGKGGNAWLLRDGRATKGTWSVNAAGTPSFVTKGGDPFVLARGSTWIELLPTKSGDFAGSLAIK